LTVTHWKLQLYEPYTQSTLNSTIQ